MKNRFMSNDEGCDQAAADAEYAEYIENICSNWRDLTDEELWAAAKTAWNTRAAPVEPVEPEPVALPAFPEATSLADLDYAQHEKPDGWDDGHFKTWQDLQVCQRNKTSLFKYAKQLRELILNSKRINQEPIAWGRVFDGDIIDCICPEEHALNEGDYTVPLYAAPVRIKDLTDDEIRAIRFNWERNEFAIDFARAVLAAHKEKNK